MNFFFTTGLINPFPSMSSDRRFFVKNKNINFARRNEPGYNAPSAPKSKAGGGYPSKQPFFKQAVKRK